MPKVFVYVKLKSAIGESKVDSGFVSSVDFGSFHGTVERGLNTIPIGELSGTHIFRATIRQIFPCTAVDQGGKI